MKRYELTIDGMSCGHCVESVSNAAQSAGASRCEVDLSTNTGNLEFDDTSTSISRIIGAITAAGYRVSAFRPAAPSPESSSP